MLIIDPRQAAPGVVEQEFRDFFPHPLLGKSAAKSATKIMEDPSGDTRLAIENLLHFSSERLEGTDILLVPAPIEFAIELH